MKPVGKPDAGNPHVRFDERGGETERLDALEAETAPFLDSTLCGAGSAKAFARRGYSLTTGERCGDQDVATYLGQVNAMKREFLRFAAKE
jgi:hypothetical protein